MGLGDVHLVFGIGAVSQRGQRHCITFFLAPLPPPSHHQESHLVYHPFASRNSPLYGPYISLAAPPVMLFYTPIAAYLQPSLIVLIGMLRQAFRRMMPSGEGRIHCRITCGSRSRSGRRSHSSQSWSYIWRSFSSRMPINP